MSHFYIHNLYSTTSNTEATNVMNDYYINKIIKLRKNLPQVTSRQLPIDNSPKARFTFSFANAGRIRKIILNLNNTAALGVDGTPVLILKCGVEILGGQISHLINRSLAEGIVPSEFKLGIVYV